jgi:hypothetical protein
MSAGFRWTLRALAWSVALVAIVPGYRATMAFKSVESAERCSGELSAKAGNNLFHAQRFALCMYLNSSFLEARRTEPMIRDVMSMNEAPCGRVGIWKSARKLSVYRVTLQDDNRFSAEALSDYTPRRNSDVGLTGYWGEAHGKLMWIYDDGHLWPPDINRVEAESTDKFTLVEANGERTEFTRERKLDAGKCRGI